MRGFIKRNLLLFFKDKVSIFFSMLSVFIILALYLLFLGDVWTSNFTEVPNAREFMDNWIMSGTLAVSSITTTMGAFGTLVEDKSKKLYKDFYSSPLSRNNITGGYMISSFLIGVIMTLITLIIAELYILSGGGALLSLSALLKVLGLIILSTFMNTAIVSFAASLIKSANAFATASTILGTLIGFLVGIYIPVGMLPGVIQGFVKAIPISHSAVLFRQVMMEAPLNVSFAGAPEAARAQINEMLGVTFKIGGTTVSPLVSVAILIAASILFYLLSLWSFSRKQR